MHHIHVQRMEGVDEVESCLATFLGWRNDTTN